MTVEELVQLPGVGRKTANVITSVIDQQPNMAVDTHVFRVSARIGLTIGAKTPAAAEKQLVAYLYLQYIFTKHTIGLYYMADIFVLPERPKCSICGLRIACKFYKNIKAL